MTKTDTIPDCKRFNLFSALPCTVTTDRRNLPHNTTKRLVRHRTTADVTAVVFKTTGPYKAGDTITAQLQFDQMIQVTGTPQLTLTIGETEKTANYALTTIQYSEHAMAFRLHCRRRRYGYRWCLGESQLSVPQWRHNKDTKFSRLPLSSRIVRKMAVIATSWIQPRQQ